MCILDKYGSLYFLVVVIELFFIYKIVKNKYKLSDDLVRVFGIR